MYIIKDNYTLKRRKNFKDYIGDINNFVKLGKQEKEQIFLEWKHGLKSPHINKEIEITDQMLISKIIEHGVENLKGWEKDYWMAIINDDKKCTEIKRSIGLTSKSDKVSEIINYVNMGWDE